MITFLKLLLSLQLETLIQMLNPARKKKERFEAICNHLKTNRFDVVFLQEVWFQKDYDRLKSCLEDENYEFSNFDSECGANPVRQHFIACKVSKLNEYNFQMSVSNCSGLITLSKFKLRKEQTASLPKGEDYLTYNKIEDLTLYSEFGINRKILMHDILVAKGLKIRLINTHFNPYEEFRQLRGKQAREVKRSLGKKGDFDVAILALDMNDCPMINGTKKWTPAYKVLIEEVGFNDGYNFWFDKKVTYPITYSDPTNSWIAESGDEEPQTLDYIMIRDQSGMKISEFVEIKVEDLKTDDGVSFSDHNSVTATIKIPL